MARYSARAACQSRSGPPGSGVGSSTPQGGGVEGRGHVLTARLGRGTSTPARRSTSRAHSAREAWPAVDDVVDAAEATAAAASAGLAKQCARSRPPGPGRRWGSRSRRRPASRRACLGARPRGRGQDLLREVEPGQAEEPGRANDRQGRRGPSVRGRRSCAAAAKSYRRPRTRPGRRARRPAWRRRTDWSDCGASVGPVGRPVGAAPVEDLVGGDDDQGRAAAGAGLGHLARGDAVAAHGQIRVAGAAVDVRPGGGVDHRVRPVPPHQALGRGRVVEVVVGQIPGQDLVDERRPPRCSTRALPSRPPAPVTATRISRRPRRHRPASREPASRAPYWRR